MNWFLQEHTDTNRLKQTKLAKMCGIKANNNQLHPGRTRATISTNISTVLTTTTSLMVHKSKHEQDILRQQQEKQDFPC